MFASKQTVWDFWPVLLHGLIVTIQLALIALFFGFAFGVIIGGLRTYGPKPVRIIASAYINIFRSIPPLLLFFGAFYGFTYAFNLSVSPFQAALIAMVLTGSAQISEVVRAAVLSVGKNQWEAAHALGLKFWTILPKIVAPQAMRVLLPPTIGVFVSILKDSAFASAIGLVEFTQSGLMVRDTTGDSLTVFLMLASAYFIMNFTLSSAAVSIERRVQLQSR